MKIAICGDVHWSTNSSIIRQRGEKYSERLENLIKSVNWFENLSKEYNCDMNIYLGDFFDRPDLNSQEISALSELNLSNNNKIFIVGNHETNLSSLDYSSTKIFNNIKTKSVKVVDRVETIPINNKLELVFIPYRLMNESISIKEFYSENNKKKIFFAHNDLSGIQQGKFITTTGIDSHSINNDKNCLLFINGHLHNGSINGKIILPGNLTGQNFNEDALKYKHLVYILDITDTSISYESFENPFAFKFYKINVSSKNDLKKLDILNKDSVVSIACKKELQEEIENKLKSLQVNKYKIYIIYEEHINNTSETQFKVGNHIKQFIEYAEKNLTPSEELTYELSRLGELD